MSPREAPNVDDLYTVPLDRFITERNRVAKELSDAGDEEAAGRVKALRKPSLTAWTLNQMARSEADLLRELMATGERMKRALEAGDHAAAREAQAARRTGLKTAGDRAKAILEAAGHASGTHVERIRSVLLQASTDDEVGREILEGRLTKEPEADAVPDDFGSSFATSGDESEAGPTASPRVEKLEARVQALRAEAEEAGRRSARLAREAESARLAADATEENARAAERAAERALRHLEEAESRLKDARR